MGPTLWMMEGVKTELPDVQVRTPYGEVKTWRIAANRADKQFALIFDPSDPSHRCDCSWDTILHCLKNDRPILL